MLTGTIGVDGAWDRWLAGMAVAHSRGDGSFTESEAESSGELDSTLTSIHPYLRYAVTEQLDVWGILGYGRGELTVDPERSEVLETDTDLVMGVFGGRGIILPALEADDFQLAIQADAMFTRMKSDAVAELPSSDAEAHRLRLILQGSRNFTWATGQSMTPSMELGLRQDWGDAETGFGVELGGRVKYTNQSHGLALEGAVRGLLAHEDSDYEEWGASGLLKVDPGAMGRGLSLNLSIAWGATASGVEDPVVQADHGRSRVPRESCHTSYPAERRGGLRLRSVRHWAANALCGGNTVGGEIQTYRLGTRLRLDSRSATPLELTLEGRRQKPIGSQPPPKASISEQPGLSSLRFSLPLPRERGRG